MTRRLPTLRTLAVATGVVVAVAAAGTVGAVQMVAHQPPAKLTVAQVVAKVRLSLVTIRTSVYRDGVVEGQGFFFSGSRHILTSAHVLAHATKIGVVNAQGATVPVAVVGIDKSLDVAELLTSDERIPALGIATGRVGVGTKVMAIGNNYSALPYTVLSGTVVGMGVQVAIKSQTLGDLMATDLVVAKAGSGGPLVDMSGGLVGMVVPGDAGRALVLPASRFLREAMDWARADNLVSNVIGPPLVGQSAASLLLEGVPLDGFAHVKTENWGDLGVHALYTRPPDYSYGGAGIDVWLEVENSPDVARAIFSVGGSVDSGYVIVASSNDLGDTTVFLQRITSTAVVYEVAWRDRNVNIYMYLASGMPAAPDISLQTLIGLAVQQEGPIGANLEDW